MKLKYIALFFLFTTLNFKGFAQKSIESQISDSLTIIANSYTWVGKVNLIDFSANTKTNRIIVTSNERLGYMPFRPDNVKRIYSAIQRAVSHKYPGFDVVCMVDGSSIEDLIPNYYRTGNVDSRKQFVVHADSHSLVSNLSRPFDIAKGMQSRNIALWQSHGWHYEQKLARWEWQRARVFQIVEDLYTQSYVLPFLVPMLENAGANILIPRERDTQTNEVIVDDDTDRDSRYREHSDRKSWKKGDGSGFSNSKKMYIQGENPFSMGTYRTVQTVNDPMESSRAEWLPNMPKAGRYAVYVSYKTFENSASKAHYTVYHKGGKTEFCVNQKMNGGTWLYLGHFYFDKGRNNQGKVVLTNLNDEEGKIISADAVKFGGGMGNIARSPNATGSVSNQKSSDNLSAPGDLIIPATTYEPEISGYPRYTEGARYWLQWAGMPDSIYSKSQGKNDYTDDFQSRGNWVNYLTGGSVVNPGFVGLNVPVDLALAFHTDAGTTLNDSIIGTLGICTVPNSEGKTQYQNGVSRWASRDLTDIIQTQIVNDIRSEYNPKWTRRGIWNKSYSESRVPEVPTMLLELLSHQNFADMRFGLDPRFRFTVSRSIYKGILRYLSSVNGTDYVVQPLPVSHFSCRFADKNKLELRWQASNDSLEPSAKPEQYVVYTRVDDGGFDNGVLVSSNRVSISIQSGKIYSFKITAVNKGGESFPSEILAACRSLNERGEVLIVNGFDRVSAPASFVIDTTYAGFLNDVDAGVPYLSDISFIGKQYEFRRSRPWLDDDAPGFGASHANYETKVIAGNSFDYPYLHGKAIKAAGFSFVSCSDESVMVADVDMNNYKFADIILGKQKQTFAGNNKKTAEFKTFPLALQRQISLFCNGGGNLLVSGAYLASDMCDSEQLVSEDRTFVENVLKLKYRTSKASVSGDVKIVGSSNPFFKKQNFSYFDTANDSSYYVESPDAIEPIGVGGNTICRYAENNLSAGVTYSGEYKICAFGFPLETIQSEKNLTKIMENVLMFFTSSRN